MSLDLSELVKLLRANFEEKAQEKTSWGRHEMLLMFERAILKTLIEMPMEKR
jgi:hypothetical protein